MSAREIRSVRVIYRDGGQWEYGPANIPDADRLFLARALVPDGVVVMKVPDPLLIIPDDGGLVHENIHYQTGREIGYRHGFNACRAKIVASAAATPLVRTKEQEERDGILDRAMARATAWAKKIATENMTTSSESASNEVMQPHLHVATLKTALRNLLNHNDINTCQHENTHRGGFLWEICDDCGQKWADDRGGKPEYVDPPAVAAARAALEGGEPIGSLPASNEVMQLRAEIAALKDRVAECDAFESPAWEANERLNAKVDDLYAENEALKKRAEKAEVVTLAAAEVSQLGLSYLSARITELETALKSLGFGDDLDAYLNLKGAIIDMEHTPTSPPDKVCWETLQRVLAQLQAARAAVGDKP